MLLPARSEPDKRVVPEIVESTDPEPEVVPKITEPTKQEQEEAKQAQLQERAEEIMAKGP